MSLAGEFNDRLGCGVVVVPGKEQPPVLTDDANRLLGLEPGVSISRTLPRPLRKFIADALASHHRLSPRRLDIVLAGRGRVSLLATAVPLSNGKKSSGVVVVLNDAGSKRDLDEHLERIERLASIGTLAAGLAHEIKNALVAGKTFIELLLEKNQDGDLAQVVRREMERIDAIVTQMLKFSGVARHPHAAVRLHEILDHSLRLVRPQLKGKAISLSQMFRAEPDLVVGDDFQLQQVFVNLFLNALEAMGPNGTLTVATETVSSSQPRAAGAAAGGAKQLRVTITDTGTGIPAEIKERLFEPFFTTKQSGTGLGLPITRRIIQEHHGDITVESRPNEGATFSIVLPTLSKAAAKRPLADHRPQSGAV